MAAFMEKSKLNNQISEKEKEINKLYAQIGQQYYFLHKEDAEPEMAAMVKAVSDAKDVILRNQERMDFANGVTTCPSCGKKVEITAQFCNGCGSRVPTPRRIIPTPEGNICIQCGALLKDGQKFCVGCGMRLITDAPAAEPVSPVVPPVVPLVVPASQVPVPPVVVEPPVVEIPAVPEVTFTAETAPVAEETPAAKTCANCGTVLEANQVFCVVCGTRVEVPAPEAAPVVAETIVEESPVVEAAPVMEEIPAQPEPMPALETAPAGKTCANCGAALEADQVFCVVCGTRVEAPAQETAPVVTEAVVVEETPAMEAAPVEEPARKPMFETTGGFGKIDKVCPKCGVAMSEDQLFCVVCGTKAEEPAPAPTGKTCAKCGAAMEDTQVFCVMCGTRAGEEDGKKLCPNCGKELLDGASFCINCGTKL